MFFDALSNAASGVSPRSPGAELDGDIQTPPPRPGAGKILQNLSSSSVALRLLDTLVTTRSNCVVTSVYGVQAFINPRPDGPLDFPTPDGGGGDNLPQTQLPGHVATHGKRHSKERKKNHDKISRSFFRSGQRSGHKRSSKAKFGRFQTFFDKLAHSSGTRRATVLRKSAFDSSIYPRPHMLFPHPRTLMGVATPPCHFTPNWDRNMGQNTNECLGCSESNGTRVNLLRSYLDPSRSGQSKKRAIWGCFVFCK